jgi:hypothetical protein
MIQALKNCAREEIQYYRLFKVACSNLYSEGVSRYNLSEIAQIFCMAMLGVTTSTDLYNGLSVDDHRLKLDALFNQIKKNEASIEQKNKPICAYLLSSQDEVRVFIGVKAYLDHIDRIKYLSKFYCVCPKIVDSQSDIKNFLESLKKKGVTDRSIIRCVHLMGHGSPKGIEIGKMMIVCGEKRKIVNKPEKEESNEIDRPINVEQLDPDLFTSCEKGVDIVLHSCSTGIGKTNIASAIAKNTLGANVYAPHGAIADSEVRVSMQQNNIPKVQVIIFKYPGMIVSSYALGKKYHFTKMANTEIFAYKDEMERDVNVINSFIQNIPVKIKGDKLDELLSRLSIKSEEYIKVTLRSKQSVEASIGSASLKKTLEGVKAKLTEEIKQINTDITACNPPLIELITRHAIFILRSYLVFFVGQRLYSLLKSSRS